MKKTISLLIIVVIFSLIIAGVVEANKNQNEVIIIINATQIYEAREIVDFIRNNGGDVSQVFIPKVIIGELSVELEQIILDKYPNRVTGIYNNQINDSILIGDSLSQTAIKYWNSKFQPKLGNMRSLYIEKEPGPILHDALVPLDRKQKDNLTIDYAQPLNNVEKPSQAPPSDIETSEYMYGDVLASIILLESNGSFDTSTENWTTTEETNVDNEIANGLIWWRARRPSNVNLTFWVYANHYKIPTKYEPINRPQSDEDLWINETMDYLGVSSGNYFLRVRKYADTIRDENNMNWAFTIFVIDSSNDADGEFSDGYFAYAYLGGPFLVMTYKNDGYGIDNMDAVAAHETGHIFQALDQYASSGCTCTEISGFLNVSNQNCENSCLSNVASIMRGQVSPFTNNAVDSYAKGQIGWRDLDSDGINDAIDSTYNGDTDSDGDGIVNYWDTDDDNDGVLDVNDNCQTTQGPSCNNGCPDTTKPTINISSPINNSKFQNYSIEIKLNSSDLCLDKVWFNDESQNIFLNSPYQTTKNFTEGSHTIIAYANDTSGNVNSAQVSFKIHVPTGKFGYLYAYTIGQGGRAAQNRAVALGDINNDNYTDLVTGAIAYSKVLLGNGSGYFTDTNQNLISDANYPTNAELADFNNDGFLDLILETDGANGGGTSVFLNNKSGYFTSVSGFASGVDYSRNFGIGDIDNDGILDVAIGKDAVNYVWMNNGSGNFQKSSFNFTGYDPHFVDLNKDGWLDLITTSKVYTNKKDHFEEVADGLGGDTFVMGDINNDGFMDIVTMLGGDGGMKVYLNNGSYGFTNFLNISQPKTKKGVLADIDNDGKLDLVVATWANWDDIVYRGDGYGVFIQNQTFGPNTTYDYHARVGDLDNNGQLDIITANYDLFHAGTVFLNDLLTVNSNPISPTVLNHKVNGRNVTLSWNNGSDVETSTLGLTYNVRIGTTSDSENIISGIIPVGYGNNLNMLNKTLVNLSKGVTYYWSVQTIDNGFKKSSWFPEQTFVINNNRPIIDSYLPLDRIINITEPLNQSFFIEASDIDDDKIFYSWYLNNTVVSTNINYTFIGNYTTAGSYNISVIVSDESLNATLYWIFNINDTNRAPIVQNVTISSTDFLNRTNGTLIVNWKFSDEESDTYKVQISNETKLYKNYVELENLRNYTSISKDNTTKDDIWLVSVRSFDGLNWSGWTNSSILIIKNSEPEITTTPITSTSEDQLYFYDLNATDSDGDTLTY